MVKSVKRYQINGTRVCPLCMAAQHQQHGPEASGEKYRRIRLRLCHQFRKHRLGLKKQGCPKTIQNCSLNGRDDDKSSEHGVPIFRQTHFGQYLCSWMETSSGGRLEDFVAVLKASSALCRYVHDPTRRKKLTGSDHLLTSRCRRRKGLCTLSKVSKT